MKVRLSSRMRWALWLPLLATSAWLVLSSGSPQPPEAQVSSPSRGPRPMATMSRTEAQTLVRRETLVPATPGAVSRDLFQPRSWNPPPPPPPAQDKPLAPPLPFAYLGKKHDADGWEVYLAQGDQTVIARGGAVIAGAYRIDRIEPPSLVMTYLPLNQAQSLAIGDAQ